MRRWLVAFTLLTVGSACAHQAAGTRTSSDRSVLTREELVQSHYSTLYDAVSALRSNWLIVRGADSFKTPSEIRVYLDNVMLGGTDALRNIAPQSVTYLKFYDGVTATTRWGTNHGAGVIFVSAQPMPARPN